MSSDQRRAWEDLPISVCPECHAIVHQDDELAHEIWHRDLDEATGRNRSADGM